jgi:transcriptional regulator with XRE-family HTH domain
VKHQQEVAERLAQLRREKSARERRDVLQSEIALAAGVSVVTYGRYENGKRKIPDEVIIALAAFYGVKPGFLRYGEPMGEQPITTFRIPDSMAETFSRARRDAATPAPAEEPPKKTAAGGRRAPKHPKGRR